MDNAIHGFFKDECEGYALIGFASLGPKFYSIKMRHERTGVIVEVVKLRGFYLKQSRHDTSVIDHTLFLQFAHQLLGVPRRRRRHVLGQFTIQTEKNDRRVVSHVRSKVVRNDVFSKRILLPCAFAIETRSQNEQETEDALLEADRDDGVRALLQQAVSGPPSRFNELSLTLPYGFSRAMLQRLRASLPPTHVPP